MQHNRDNIYKKLEGITTTAQYERKLKTEYVKNATNTFEWNLYQVVVANLNLLPESLKVSGEDVVCCCALTGGGRWEVCVGFRKCVCCVGYGGYGMNSVVTCFVGSQLLSEQRWLRGSREWTRRRVFNFCFFISLPSSNFTFGFAFQNWESAR